MSSFGGSSKRAKRATPHRSTLRSWTVPKKGGNQKSLMKVVGALLVLLFVYIMKLNLTPRRVGPRPHRRQGSSDTQRKQNAEKSENTVCAYMAIALSVWHRHSRVCCSNQYCTPLRHAGDHAVHTRGRENVRWSTIALHG